MPNLLSDKRDRLLSELVLCLLGKGCRPFLLGFTFIVRFPSTFAAKLPRNLQGQRTFFLKLCKDYWPETRGYVIYSPRGVPEGVVLAMRY